MSRLDRSRHPLPYHGQELDRRQALGSVHARRTFGSDQVGERTYRFNRLGFRGADFDPAAPFRVFAFGESHAFGYFVDYEECWPSRFVDLWIRHLDLDRRDVCYLNFADAGSSNAAIARSVVVQCSAVHPDLVLVHFGDLRRSEAVVDGTPHRIGHWLLREETELLSRAPSPEGDPRRTLRELIDRGLGFYRFAQGPDRPSWFEEGVVDPTCVLENLRHLLLVQVFCRSQGIALVAACEDIDVLRSSSVRADPTLAPLAALLDPEVLCDFGIASVEGDWSDDRGHAGPRRHDRFARAVFDFYRRHAGSSPAVARAADPVRAFYEELPFNHFGSARAAARSALANALPDTYPDLHRLLVAGRVRSVADCGCGAGWLTHTLALHYDLEVTGVDFTPRALDRAREVARRLGLGSRVRFALADLQDLVCDEGFDLVVSLGALHHTPDPQRTFDRLRRLVAEDGYLYLGLYHEFGRRPFLEHFHGILEDGGEDAALAEFRRLNPERADDEHLRSWFRDQVQHPRESRHTLREAATWLAAGGLELVSTSINSFRPFADLEDLFELEARYEARSRRALRRGRFFPGFFTLLAHRPPAL